ncbi:Scarecrow-like protein 34 [Morella rubra]|uniref:Scarecrow-like protein 34 n=1 Tax=Morella rubra TaxID=262757 RepID=A0A6A1WKY6_9ROSI|nr:Scarecrow-like protein 34 [Morella rubra]
MAQTVFHLVVVVIMVLISVRLALAVYSPWFAGLGDYQASFAQATLPGDQVCQPKLRPNRGSLVLDNPTNGTSNHTGDGLKLLTRDIFIDKESILQFRRGSEDASKFLPKGNQLGIDFESDMVLTGWKQGDHKIENENSRDGSKGRKNHERGVIWGPAYELFKAHLWVQILSRATFVNPRGWLRWSRPLGFDIENLTIDESEVLAVNCSFKLKNLLDETVEETSPRNAVLDLIRRLNPDLFVHSIVNGGYNSPFFVTRFREMLFHFSAFYDSVDIILPSEHQSGRLMFEREFYGREIMNVIACEGLERVERPEIYKQWQLRTMRAGFRQLPLDQELRDRFRSRTKEWYHKDFGLDEGNHWLLQGWKDRIVYASSCWVPA